MLDNDGDGTLDSSDLDDDNDGILDDVESPADAGGQLVLADVQPELQVEGSARNEIHVAGAPR